MAYQRLIDKFAAAYDLYGIYLYDSGRLIALNQKEPAGLIILRENQHKLTQNGAQTIDYQNKEFGIIINKTSGNPKIVLLSALDRIPVLAKHWKRVLPAILKSIPLEEIVEEKSPVTHLARIASQIGELFDEMIGLYSNGEHSK